MRENKGALSQMKNREIPRIDHVSVTQNGVVVDFWFEENSEMKSRIKKSKIQ